jgi:hypothetical protein
MANESTITYNINVQTQAVSQKSSLKVESIERDLTYMRNLIIRDAAFKMIIGKEKLLTQNIDSTFRAIVERELSRMGREIAKLIFVPDGSMKTSGGYLPRGSLSIQGNTSQAMQGLVSPVKLADGTGYWPARNYKYVKKRRKSGGGKWFQVTGELKQTLKNASTYTQAYGPIKVDYKKAPKGADIPKTVAISRIGPGQGGRRSTVVVFGNVSISVLGTITANQLNDPSRRQPSPWSTGLFESLDARTEAKLLNREEAYRPFLEQFLAFYLTRSIPNAVFRKIEDVMYGGVVGGVRAVGTRKVGKARFSSKNLASITEQLKPLTQA